MKKITIFLTVLAIIGVIAFTHGIQIVKALGSMIRSGNDMPTGTYAMQTSAVQTSPNFLQTGLGTTTLTILSDNLSAVSIDMQVFASSTDRSAIELFASASDDGVNFFDYDKATVTLASSTTATFSYLPSTLAATSTKHFDLKIIPARYTKLAWSVQATTTGSSYKDGYNLWVNIIGQISGIK